ncbi:MAG: hypothetical protein JW760_00495 [Spirochaetales bacterium]|nr:hypothetical protein [Spirochaetales bacterium]
MKITDVLWSDSIVLNFQAENRDTAVQHLVNLLSRVRSLNTKTALMDDIEPENSFSPPIIHVVSYSEGFRLADPEIVEESIRITRHALAEYRRLKKKGWIDDMDRHEEVRRRTEGLITEAHLVLDRINREVPQPLTAEGLYRVFASGFLPVPYLWECREEFPAAVARHTRVVRGAVVRVDKRGKANSPY